MRILFLFLFLFLFLLSPIASSQDVKVGIGEKYPPFTTGTLDGFDYLLMAEICSLSQLECEFYIRPHNDLIAEVSNGKFDVAIGGIAATSERSKVAYVSCPYMSYSGRKEHFYARSSRIDLSKEKIAVVKGTIQKDAVEHEELNYVEFDKESDAIQAVLRNRAGAYFGTEASLKTVKQASQALRVVGSIQMPPVGVSLLISKSRPEILAIVNKSIEELLNEGFISKLHQRYRAFNPNFESNRYHSNKCFRALKK